MSSNDQPYSHRKLPNEPIVVVSVHKNYILETHWPESTAASIDMLNTMTEPAFWILDMGHLIFDLNTLIDGAAVLSFEPTSVFRHPNVREVIIVEPDADEVVKLSAQGLKTEVYGYVKACVMNSVDDAIAYARAKM